MQVKASGSVVATWMMIDPIAIGRNQIQYWIVDNQLVDQMIAAVVVVVVVVVHQMAVVVVDRMIVVHQLEVVVGRNQIQYWIVDNQLVGQMIAVVVVVVVVHQMRVVVVVVVVVVVGYPKRIVIDRAIVVETLPAIAVAAAYHPSTSIEDHDMEQEAPMTMIDDRTCWID
jgi:hypothetical protein